MIESCESRPSMLGDECLGSVASAEGYRPTAVASPSLPALLGDLVLRRNHDHERPALEDEAASSASSSDKSSDSQSVKSASVDCESWLPDEVENELDELRVPPEPASVMVVAVDDVAVET